MVRNKLITLGMTAALAGTMGLGLVACGGTEGTTSADSTTTEATSTSADADATSTSADADATSTSTSTSTSADAEKTDAAKK